jgi:hypothetical protein
VREEKEYGKREERFVGQSSVVFGSSLSFVNSIQKTKKKKQKREEREKTYRSGVDGEAGASLGGNSGGLKVNLLCFNSASVKERRRERVRTRSITDKKKKRDPREKDNTREKKKTGGG